MNAIGDLRSYSYNRTVHNIVLAIGKMLRIFGWNSVSLLFFNHYLHGKCSSTVHEDEWFCESLYGGIWGS